MDAFSAAARLARTVRIRWVTGIALSGPATSLRRQGRLAEARDVVLEVTVPRTRAPAAAA